ncbi:MAG: cell division protein FtsA, partial [Rhodocyclaceae bacterium]|nr:cell division protein FtsA [Rhodocyclaceae bacterium]
MSKEKNRDLIVGLDIGTSKIVAIVAELNAEGQLSILGLGTQDTQESRGLKKGVVVNIEATVNSISKAIAEVEMMAGCKVKEVYTGIAGSHIKSKDSNGMAVVKDKEVTQYDIARAIEAANATPISADDQILHTLVQEFIVDGQDGVKDPLGMDAKRLEVKVHLVTGAVTAVQNIVKCVRRCGLEVVDLVLQPLASGNAVLTEDEKDVGVCLVDVGGGTTDIAVFSQGAIRHTAVIPIAGDQITNDIAIAPVSYT